MSFLITPNEHQLLLNKLQEAEQRYKSTMQEGLVSGGEQDGHHDEGFQLSIRESAVAARQVEELRSLQSSVKVFEPIEQFETARIGNGVQIVFSDQSSAKYILEGKVIEANRDEIKLSIYSPLGKAILGAKIGEQRQFSSPKHGTRIFTVTHITLPSAATNFQAP